MVVKIKNLTFAPSALTNRWRQKAAVRPHRTRRRWRVEIINENTLSRIWSLRLTGLKAWIFGGTLLAAIASLIAVIIIFTPVRAILSGELPGKMRDRYIDMALRIDSISERARIGETYSMNIMSILTDSINADSLRAEASKLAEENPTVDSLLPASEREKQFIKQFEARERYNLSVLSPIAAEGMIFEPPTSTEDGSGNVSAIYRGTVISVENLPGGRSNITVQHPNDFISIYRNMSDTYVDKGAKVAANQRIGYSTTDAPMLFELWHSGTLLDAGEYIKN